MQMAKYADKAEMQYVSEGGERVYELEEVTITAERKPEKMYPAYAPDIHVSYSATAKEIEEFPVVSMSHLLSRLTKRSNVPITFGEGDAGRLLLVDDAPMPIEFLDDINPNDVAQIDIIDRFNTETTVFGMKGVFGVIMVYTKRGENSNYEYPPFHIKTYSPLGYQTPIEFYAPKYDTPEKRNAPTSDLRTTIHWQPVVQTDSEGVASFEFYTADEPTSYTMVIEGLANDGNIIRKEEKMW